MLRLSSPFPSFVRSFSFVISSLDYAISFTFSTFLLVFCFLQMPWKIWFLFFFVSFFFPAWWCGLIWETIPSITKSTFDFDTNITNVRLQHLKEHWLSYFLSWRRKHIILTLVYYVILCFGYTGATSHLCHCLQGGDKFWKFDLNIWQVSSAIFPVHHHTAFTSSFLSLKGLLSQK